MQKRREKGLCFNCDEKFVPGHKCKTKQAFLIELNVSDNEDTEESTSDSQQETAEISVHAISGVNGLKTHKFTATIRNRRIVVLVDNGSSHNFINKILADKFNLTATDVEAFKVRVANGEGLICNKLYKGVPIRMQGVDIKADLYVSPLVGQDVVLGV